MGLVMLNLTPDTSTTGQAVSELARLFHENMALTQKARDSLTDHYTAEIVAALEGGKLHLMVMDGIPATRTLGVYEAATLVVKIVSAEFDTTGTRTEGGPVPAFVNRDQLVTLCLEWLE